MERLMGSMALLADGCYAGMLRSAMMRTHVELRPGPIVGGQRTFEVRAGADFVFGHGRQPADDEGADLVMELDAPELPRPIALTARRGAGGDWMILWTPRAAGQGGG